MSSRKYHLIISDEAKGDFRDILSFTRRMWGDRQVDEYGDMLHNALRTIEQTPKIGHTKTDLQEGILCYRARQHLIFYRIDGSKIYVLRILHSKMDYIRYLDETTH